MYTQCPKCDAMFRVNPRQLRTARGRVRCGRCLNVFDGIAQLRHAPTRLTADETSPSATASQTEPMPAVLREDLERMESTRRARRRTLAYAGASAALLVAMVLQVVWFMPNEVQLRYPQARPWLEQYCAFSGCRLREARVAPRVRVVNRDVRVHPRYEGALQITATFVSVANYRQPYPRVQFTLFNVNGETIASRIFTPQEYIDSRFADNSHLPPNRPLQIAFEVLAPEQVAVSYEFQFL